MGMKPSQKECEECEDWLTTYADAITLLMAFFVMLVSMSKINIPLYEEIRAGIKEEIGKKDTDNPISVLKNSIQDVVYQMQADEVVKVEKDEKGIVIELASSAFYKPGSADIREEAVPVLLKIAQTIGAPHYSNYVINIEGHTDDDPISTPRYPSNWELSAGRASGVVRFLVEQNFEAWRMKASGFAETRPKVPNRDPQGNPIPENQAENRRVVIRLEPLTAAELKELMKTLNPQQMQGLTAGSSAPRPGLPSQVLQEKIRQQEQQMQEEAPPQGEPQ